MLKPRFNAAKPLPLSNELVLQIVDLAFTLVNSFVIRRCLSKATMADQSFKSVGNEVEHP